MPKKPPSSAASHRVHAEGILLGRALATKASIGFAASPAAPPHPGGLIRYAGEGHGIVIGYSGSGKTSGGTGIVAAREHPGSLICIDPCGTILEHAADYRRARGHRVAVIDARPGRDSDSLEPLSLAGGGALDTMLVGREAAALIVPSPENEKDPYWSITAASCIASVIADAMTPGGGAVPPRLSAIRDFFAAADAVMTMANCLDRKAFRLESAHAAIANLIQLPSQSTLPCMLSVLQQHLCPWDTPLIRTLTDRTTFDLEALIAGDGQDLFIVVPPSLLLALRSVLRLWLAALINACTRRTHMPAHRTLFLVDEAAALGEVPALITAQTMLRSRCVQLVTMWQALSQLQACYGLHGQTLLDNAAWIQICGVRSARQARDFRDLVGGMSEAELLSLTSRQQVLKIEEAPPVIAEKVQWFSLEAEHQPPLALPARR